MKEFLFEIGKVAEECYRVLKNDKFCAILMGDMRKKGMVQSLAFETMRVFELAGFKTKEIIINEEEANIVRYMFERYVEGVGSSTIAKELTAKGIKTPKGGDKWCESTVRGILKNEKYKGDVLQGKTFTIAIFDTKSETKITKDEINIAGVYRAKIMNNGPNFDIKNVDILNTLDEDFSKLLNEEITKFIEELQKNDTDILGFANKYYIKSRDKNDKLWQNAKINTNIKVIINKKGLVYSIYEND